MKPGGQGGPVCGQPRSVPGTEGLCWAQVSVCGAELPGSRGHRRGSHGNPGHVVQTSLLPQSPGRHPDSQSLLDVTVESIGYFWFASGCFYSGGAEGREQKPCGQVWQLLHAEQRG